MDYQILGMQIYHWRLLYKIYDILVGSALDVFGKKLIYTNVSKKEKNAFKKPWLTQDYKTARRKFRRAKKVYKHFGGDIFTEDLYEKKDYRRKTKRC